jgi:hypothetical protein
MVVWLLAIPAGALGQRATQDSSAPPVLGSHRTAPPSNSGASNSVSAQTPWPASHPNPTGPSTAPGGTQPNGGKGRTGGTTTTATGEGGVAPVGNPRVSNSGLNPAVVAATAAAAVGIATFIKLHHSHAENSGATVKRLGLSLHYPEDWQLNPRLTLEQDPISFNNFNSSYLGGGIIPLGGADIDIAYFPGVRVTPQMLIASELSDATDKRLEDRPYKINGKNGMRVLYTDRYTRGFTYKNVAVYVPQEDGLYKFFLTYHDGDEKEKDFNDDFEHILKSVHFER